MQIPSTLSTANLGWFYYLSCLHWSGIAPATTGSGNVTPSRRQLEVAFDWGVNLWAGFPEYLLHLAAVAQQAGLDLRRLGTRFIATFLGPDLDGSLRKMMEGAWHCPVFDNYGTHEVGLPAFECQEKDGLHLMEDMFIIEVAAVDTDAILPDGEKGNLVITSLYRHHPPLIRYNLRDYIRIVSDGQRRCGCGSYTRRMDHFLGRSDDMVKIRGTNVFPMACVRAVTSDDRTTGEWLCVVERRGAGLEIREDMTVQVEVKDGIEGRAEELIRILEERLKSDLGIRVTVELVAAGRRIGTGIAILALYHPTRLAEDCAVVDIISKGRLILGVGQGYQEGDFAAFGLKVSDRVSLFEEGIEILRRAWTEEKVYFVGKRHTLQNIMVTPKPVQKPHPPIWVAALGDEPMKRAGRLGDALLADSFQLPERLKRRVALYRETAES